MAHRSRLAGIGPVSHTLSTSMAAMGTMPKVMNGCWTGLNWITGKRTVASTRNQSDAGIEEKMRISEATGSCRLQADIQIAGLQSFNFA